MATARFLNEFRQERGREFTAAEGRLLNRLRQELILEDEPAAEIDNFLREWNYEEFQQTGSFLGPGFEPAASSSGRQGQNMINRLLNNAFETQREETRQDMILTTQEIFQNNPTAMNYGVRLFEGATQEELDHLLNSRLDMYELDITGNLPSGVVGTDFVPSARIRDLLASAPQAQRQNIINGAQAVVRTVAGNLAQSQGVPRQVGEVGVDVAASFMRQNSGPVLATLGAIAAKIKSGYRDVSGLSILLGGLGVAGIGGMAARHYLNDAEDFINDVEEAKREGVKFGPREELQIEKLRRHLTDVNNLGNAAAQGGALVPVDSTIVKSMIALENSGNNPEREQHLQNLVKLTYIKNYQLAMYDRQLRKNSKISGAPPKLRPGKYGIRPIRITPDWRGAII